MKFLFRSTDGHASSQPQAIGFFSSWTLPKRSISFLGLFFWRRSGMLALGLDGGNGFPSCSPWPALESWSTNLLARLFDTPRGSVRATLYLWCSSRSPSMCSTPYPTCHLEQHPAASHSTAHGFLHLSICCWRGDLLSPWCRWPHSGARDLTHFWGCVRASNKLCQVYHHKLSRWAMRSCALCPPSLSPTWVCHFWSRGSTLLRLTLSSIACERSCPLGGLPCCLGARD